MKSIIMQKIALDKERQRTISTGSLDGAIITTTDVLITDKEEIAKVKERLLNSATADLKKAQCNSLQNIPSITVSEATEVQTNGDAKGGNGDTVSLVESDSEQAAAVRFSPENPRVEHIKKDELTVPLFPRKRTTSNISARSGDSFRKSSESLRKEVSRPMYRADIFYGGSVRSLAEYKQSSEDMQSYIKSTTSLPPGVVGGKCWAPFTAAMGKMFDFSVMRSPTFLIMLTSYFLAMLGRLTLTLKEWGKIYLMSLRQWQL